MKNIILISGILSCLFIACSNDDNKILSPSDSDWNWLEIKDNPDHELDHLIYTVYRTSGMSVFYNDTIWQDEIRNVFETLKVNYEITAEKEIAYTKSSSQKALMAAVNLLNDLVISKITNEAMPLSYFLVDTCWTDEEIVSNVYKCLRTTVIGNVQEIGDMTIDEKKEFAAKIAATDLTYYIFENQDKELQAFYKVTNDVYNKDAYNLRVSASSTPKITTPFEEFGIISGTAHSKNYTPTMLEDVYMFIQKAFINDPSFETTYKDNPLILEKYRLIQEIIKKYMK